MWFEMEEDVDGMESYEYFSISAHSVLSIYLSIYRSIYLSTYLCPLTIK